MSQKHIKQEMSQKCAHKTILFVSARCNDQCYIKILQDNEPLIHKAGRVPQGLGIDSPDYPNNIEFRICLTCQTLLTPNNKSSPRLSIEKAYDLLNKSTKEDSLLDKPPSYNPDSFIPAGLPSKKS
jgi:hypothetical protein